MTLSLALVEFESGAEHTVLVSHIKETYMHSNNMKKSFLDKRDIEGIKTNLKAWLFF